MDRVQVMKQEWSSLGGDVGDEAPYATPIEPQEDAIEAAGVYLQDALKRDETVLISRSADDLQFKDGNNVSGLTLTQLASGALPPATAVGQVIVSLDGSTFTVEIPIFDLAGWTAEDTGELIVEG